MNKLFGYILGNGRVTSILGLILGAPGVYETIQAFLAGSQINLRAAITSVALVLFGRFAAQEPKTA